MVAEVQKHGVNDRKCAELGWVAIPLAVETYGCWGAEAQSTISPLASRMAMQLQCSKSKAITTIYQCLNLTLVRAMLELYFHVQAFSGLRVEFNLDFCMFFK